MNTYFVYNFLKKTTFQKDKSIEKWPKDLNEHFQKYKTPRSKKMYEKMLATQ